MMETIIYCDDRHEGLWFRGLAADLAGTRVERMGNRVQNPDAVNDLLAYDRPDVVLISGGTPRLVLEKTSECPTGHNIGQRVGRIVRAAELEVPSITFLPFDARKHGVYSGIVNLNARLLDAFIRMSRIHEVPVLAVNWVCDERGELVRDGSQDAVLSETVQNFVRLGFDPDCGAFQTVQTTMRQELEERVRRYPRYASPPGSVRVTPTESFVRLMQERDRSFALPQEMAGRGETVIYTADMSPAACRREDPYTGMQFVYDYRLCRTGPRPSDKSRNLVFNVPRVSVQRWLEANPDDPSRKSRMWYVTANGIALKDGFLPGVR